MDQRIQRLVATLREHGYTDKYVPEHWIDDWAGKRWYSVDAPDSSILQIVRADKYTRVNLTDAASERPFAVLSYVSEEYPDRPKTGFNRHDETRMTFDEVEKIIGGLVQLEAREAA